VPQVKLSTRTQPEGIREPKAKVRVSSLGAGRSTAREGGNPLRRGWNLEQATGDSWKHGGRTDVDGGTAETRGQDPPGRGLRASSEA
jgi:hypothetical protein